MDLTGEWSFKEDFGYGNDQGVANLIQIGDEIKGVLEFTEYIEDESPFSIKCNLIGKLDEDKITLSVIAFEIISSADTIEYYPEIREGIVNKQGQIVGSSEDTQGICGVFVFEKVSG